MGSLSILTRCLLLFVVVIINAKPGFFQHTREEDIDKFYQRHHVIFVGASDDKNHAKQTLGEFKAINEMLQGRWLGRKRKRQRQRQRQMQMSYLAEFIAFGRMSLADIEEKKSFQASPAVQPPAPEAPAPEVAAPEAPAPEFTENLEAALALAKRKFMERKTTRTRTLILFINSINTPEDVYVLSHVRPMTDDLKENVFVRVMAVPMSSKANREELRVVASSKEDVLTTSDAATVVESIQNSAETVPKPSIPTKILPYPCPAPSATCPPDEKPCKPTYPCPMPCPPCQNPPCSPCPAPCPCTRPPCPNVQPCRPKPGICPKAPYMKVGCYKLPEDKHYNIIWITPGVAPKHMPNWEKYLSTLVCQCSKSAKRRGLTYFGVKYFKPKGGLFYRGACFTTSTENVNKYTHLLRAAYRGCIDSTTGVCNLKDRKDCIGKSNTIFGYRRTDDNEDVEEEPEDPAEMDEQQEVTDGGDSEGSDDNVGKNNGTIATVTTGNAYNASVVL